MSGVRTRSVYVALWLLMAACGGDYADPTREFAPPLDKSVQHPVIIDRPTTLGVVDAGRVDVHGTPIGVRCATCHGDNPSKSWVTTPGEPFHTGIKLDHGTNTCNHCHDKDDRTKLRLADKTLLDVDNAIRLCGQCHGVQKRDYEHGSHGGMNGFWDLTQGPRHRNHCVACHAPHSPAYELPVQPVHPPRDRFIRSKPAESHGDHGEHGEESH